jgi:hypothetical protein
MSRSPPSGVLLGLIYGPSGTQRALEMPLVRPLDATLPLPPGPAAPHLPEALRAPGVASILSPGRCRL